MPKDQTIDGWDDYQKASRRERAAFTNVWSPCCLRVMHLSLRCTPGSSPVPVSRAASHGQWCGRHFVRPMFPRKSQRGFLDVPKECLGSPKGVAWKSHRGYSEVPEGLLGSPRGVARKSQRSCSEVPKRLLETPKGVARNSQRGCSEPPKAGLGPGSVSTGGTPVLAVLLVLT